MGALKNPRVGALALLGVFLIPRLFLLGNARWTSEESWFFSEIYATASGQRWEALGTPVSGTRGAHPGPYFYWLLAPFAWTGSPWLVSFGVALLDSLGHLLALAGLRTLWQHRGTTRAAWVITALLLALSPWALLYADRPWNSNLVSLPVGLAIYGLARWWSNQSKAPAFACLTVGLAVLPSFHLSAPLLGLPILVAVAIGWRRLNRRSLLVGALLSGLIWAPYISHEWQHDGANTRGLLSRSLPSVSSASNTLLALGWPLRLVAPEIGYHAQKGYWSPYDPGAWRGSGKAHDAWWRIHGGLALPGLLIGLVLTLVAWGSFLGLLRQRRRADLFDILLLTGTLLGWALLLFAGRRAYPHYLHPLIPLYAGAIGLGLERLWRRPKSRLLITTALAAHLLTGLLVAKRFQAENDRPFGLNANLYSLDILQRFDGTQPHFCGALGYRSKAQLERIAMVRNPTLLLNGEEFALVHALPGKIPKTLAETAQWQEQAHGVAHFLLLGTLPQSWRRVGCR